MNRQPSKNKRTLYEAYLEHENSLLRAENEYLRNRDRIRYVPLSPDESARPMGLSTEYTASYKIDKLSSPGVLTADIINVCFDFNIE